LVRVPELPVPELTVLHLAVLPELQLARPELGMRVPVVPAGPALAVLELAKLPAPELTVLQLAVLPELAVLQLAGPELGMPELVVPAGPALALLELVAPRRPLTLRLRRRPGCLTARRRPGAMRRLSAGLPTSRLLRLPRPGTALIDPTVTAIGPAVVWRLLPLSAAGLTRLAWIYG
jgi:hypothetical protein